MLLNLKNDLHRLKEAITKVKKHNLNPKEKVDFNKSLINFKERRKEYYQKVINNSLKSIKNFNLQQLTTGNKKQEDKILEIKELISEFSLLYSKDKFEKLLENINKTIEITENLKSADVEKLKISFPKVPEAIKNEIYLDLKELEKCFNTGCHRSAVIICGRILETALHRKYFEVTSMDLLEKNPGMGLGKIIAKLTEKNVKFEPGITQQIHLINQLRIFSVHKKREPFYPTSKQTEAMILYTLDILNKLF